MSWRFRKRVKVTPGVYLNLTTKGITTSIGSRYSSELLEPPNNKKFNTVNPESLVDELNSILNKTYADTEEIKSEDVIRLTSNNFDILKHTIIAAHDEANTIDNILNKKYEERMEVEDQLLKKQNSFFKFLFKKKINSLAQQLEEYDHEIIELKQQLELSILKLDIEQDDTFYTLYKNVEKSFELISRSDKIWDKTTTKSTNQYAQRTSATSEIERIPTKIYLSTLDYIVTKHTPLKLENKNGADIYFYPGFIIMDDTGFDFAIIDYSDLEIKFDIVRFIEEDEVPKDSEVAGQTWLKVNKDGTPDRRFSYNYQIPIVLYGEVELSTTNGLYEKFMFSNVKYTELFYKALEEYINAIKTANALINSALS